MTRHYCAEPRTEMDGGGLPRHRLSCLLHDRQGHRTDDDDDERSEVSDASLLYNLIGYGIPLPMLIYI